MRRITLREGHLLHRIRSTRDILVRTRDDEHKLAARLMLPIVCEEVTEGRATELLKLLRQLPCCARLSLRAESRCERSKCLTQSVRSLVEDECLGVGGDTHQNLAPLLLLAREESDEGEPLQWQSRADERRECGVRARQRRDGDALGDGASCEVAAGVGNARQPRVADADDRCPRAEALNQVRPLFLLVVLVVARHGRVDVVVCEKSARVPRVLGGDHIRRAQHLDGAIGDVAEVADGRRTEIEHSCHCHSSAVFSSFVYTARTLHCQVRVMKTPPLLKFRLYFSFLAFHFHAVHI